MRTRVVQKSGHRIRNPAIRSREHGDRIGFVRPAMNLEVRFWVGFQQRNGSFGQNNYLLVCLVLRRRKSKAMDARIFLGQGRSRRRKSSHGDNEHEYPAHCERLRKTP